MCVLIVLTPLEQRKFEEELRQLEALLANYAAFSEWLRDQRRS
jgi:hypothetical protein